MLVTCDDGLRQYLGQVLTQLSGDTQLHRMRAQWLRRVAPSGCGTNAGDSYLLRRHRCNFLRRGALFEREAAQANQLSVGSSKSRLTDKTQACN